MKRICMILLPMLFALTSCNPGFSTNQSGDDKKVTIIQDANFDGDFSVTSTTSANPVQTGILRFNNTAPALNTVWKLAQWGSKKTISTAQLKVDNNRYIYENEAKRIVKEMEENKRSTLFLAVYASKEYKAPRKQGQLWPHLLIEQMTGDTKGIANYASVQFTLDVRISRCENKMDTGFDPALHCAQTTAYFTVSDQNPESKGYGDYLWFGIPIFDTRYEYPPGSAIQDNGAPGTTGKLIYTPPGKEILSQNLMNGRWEKISVDILPYIRKAFEQGKKIGFLPESKWEDMKFTSFNLGWEVTGTYDVEMQITNLGCIGTLQ